MPKLTKLSFSPRRKIRNVTRSGKPGVEVFRHQLAGLHMINFLKGLFSQKRSVLVALICCQMLAVPPVHSKEDNHNNDHNMVDLIQIKYSLPNNGAINSDAYLQNRRSGSEKVDEVLGPQDSAGQSNKIANNDAADDENRLNKLRGRVKRLEITYQALNAVDAIQTIICIQGKNCQEGNPILGKRPGVSKILAFKAAAGLIHYTAYRIGLNDKQNLKSTLLMEWITVGVQGFVVGWNLHVMM